MMATAELPIRPRDPQGELSPRRSKSSVVHRLFILVALIVVGLHGYAAFSPSSLNWGFHHLAFSSTPVKLIWITFAFAVLILPTRRVLMTGTEKGINWIARFPSMLVYLLLAIGWGALCWLGRSQWHLSGDGALVLRNLTDAIMAGRMSRLIATEPLTNYVSWYVYRALRTITEPEPVLVYWVISIACGVVFLILLLQFVRNLHVDRSERVLLGGLILFSGGSMLFFGHVEDYTIFYTTVFAYLMLGYLSVTGKRTLIFASAVLGLMIALHFTGLLFLPSYLVLLSANLEKGSKHVVTGVAVLLVVTGVLFMLCGYTATTLLGQFKGSGSHLIPLIHITNPKQNYPVLSWQYFLEQFNLQLLIAPFALVTAIIFTVLTLKKVRWSRPASLYLPVAGVSGCGFLLTINPEISLSRDWDLFSAFFLPLLVLLVVWYDRHLKLERKKEFLFVITVLTLLHSIPSAALAASEQKSFARHLLLIDNRLWGKHASYTYFEELAIYFRSQMKYDQALEAYQQYQNIDPANPRIYASIAHLYELMKDKANEKRYLEAAIQKGCVDPMAYFSLGLLVAENGDFERAILLNQKAVTLNPSMADAYHNLGLCFLQGRGDCERASQYFEKALSLNSSLTASLKMGFASSICLKELQKAESYLKKFVARRPGDPDIPGMEKALNLLRNPTDVGQGAFPQRRK